MNSRGMNAVSPYRRTIEVFNEAIAMRSVRQVRNNMRSELRGFVATETLKDSHRDHLPHTYSALSLGDDAPDSSGQTTNFAFRFWRFPRPDAHEHAWPALSKVVHTLGQPIPLMV